MVEQRGWQTYANTHLRYCRRVVDEFYEGINPRDYQVGMLVMVRGREVRLNVDGINRYFIIELPEDQEENITDGVTWNDLFNGRNLDLANALVIDLMTFWVAPDYPIRHTNLKIELGVWNIFISHSLRPRTHYSTVSSEVRWCEDPMTNIGMGTWTTLEMERDVTSLMIDEYGAQLQATMEMSRREHEERLRAKQDPRGKGPMVNKRAESSDDE
ncbi:hypothetical protein Q3G72_011126 [Acer saccharum]|nr:hypothetical protein Q3G72_011126 [Acer saccharum]